MKQKEKRITIGLDLGERRHRFCALNQRGEVVEEGSLANDRSALARLTAGYRGALAVMEAGAHSPWVSRYLEELGFEVIVSNPVLYPVRHGSEEAQQDLLRIKLRDSLVRARVALINSVRFSLKSLG
jgi:transposase